MTLGYPIPRQGRQSDIFVGDGTATYGPFDFKVFDVADVEVWSKTSADGIFVERPSVVVTKSSGLDLDTFSITFPATQPSTTQIVVRAARIDERSAGVVSGTRINPSALEKELSKISTEVQELRRDADRGWKTDFGGNPLTLELGVGDGDILVKLGDRIVKGPNAAAIQAATDATYAAALNANTFASKINAQAFKPTVAPAYIRVAGYAIAGDGGAALYKKVNVAPAHLGKLSLTLSDNVTVQWYEIAEQVLSPRMFGAKGDGSTIDTAAFQATSDTALAQKLGEIYIPAGNYIVKGWTIDTSTSTVRFAKKLNIRGDGSHSTLIDCKDYPYSGLSVLGPASQPESHFGLSGVRFLGSLVAGSIGVNIYIAAYMKWEDVIIEGFDLNLRCQNVEQCVFTRLSCNWGRSGADFLASSATTDPNSLTFVECAMGSNTYGGLSITKCNALTVIGGSFQYNGTQGGGAAAFGVKLLEVGSGYGTVVFVGTIWEGNGGDADLYLYQTTDPSVVTLEGCSFARSNNTKYSTNNILVAGAAADQIVRISGTTFEGFNSYVPNAARKYIAKTNVNAKIISDNNFFKSSLEAPAAGALRFAASYLTGSVTYDPPSLADGGEAYPTIYVPGAAFGDPCLVSFSNSLAGITVSAYVSAADTVTAVFTNTTGFGTDLASGTLKAIVFKV